MTAAALLALGYLLGSIPFAWVVGRLAGGVDIRRHGSGNVGATNVVRVVGLWPGLLAGALDFGKGALAVVAARALRSGGPDTVAVLAGVCAVAGHLWPVWLRFRGGKGVLTTAGVFLALAWLPLLLAVAAWSACFALTRYVSLGSLAAATTLAGATVFLPGSWAVPSVRVAAVASCTLVVLRHPGNIRRLVAGTEARMGARPKTRRRGPRR